MQVQRLGRRHQPERAKLFEVLRQLNGGAPFVVAYRGYTGKPDKRELAEQPSPYDWRAILHNEVVFDVGDNTNDWAVVMRESAAIWRAIWDFGEDFWPALSGGRGTHTHVFIDPPEWKQGFALAVLGRAWDYLGYEPDVDTGHLYANVKGSKLIREFGSAKRFPKTLVERPFDFIQEDLSREKAYERCKVRIPEGIGVAKWPVGARHAAVAATFNGICPRSEACFFDTDLDGFCARCPIAR